MDPYQLKAIIVVAAAVVVVAWRRPVLPSSKTAVDGIREHSEVLSWFGELLTKGLAAKAREREEAADGLKEAADGLQEAADGLKEAADGLKTAVKCARCTKCAKCARFAEAQGVAAAAVDRHVGSVQKAVRLAEEDSAIMSQLAPAFASLGSGDTANKRGIGIGIVAVVAAVGFVALVLLSSVGSSSGGESGSSTTDRSQ